MSAFRFRPGRRLWLTVGTLAMVTAAVLFLVASASAVLTGSPSNFESGNDPTLGVGNEIVDTTGDADWITVEGAANYVHLTDASNTTGDDSFTPGQKQDTTCPAVENHKNPPKDDFTDVASFNETAANGDIYLYGATIRFAANGNASENIELKQGTSGLCAGSTTLLQRTPGDKLLAIDYKGGGSAVEFHLLTWVASGACNVGSDTAPCWGATVATLTPAVAEGGVSITDFTAAQNPISDVPLKAGQFAEFGVNLAAAGIIPNTGVCAGFAQTVWESRSSGSSFVSSTKDIKVEDHSINTCAHLSVTKTGSDGGSQAGAVFTLYNGSDTSGTVVGTCTVQADGTCTGFPADLNPGTYTIDETTVPTNYTKDASLPFTFTLAAGDNLPLAFVDVAQRGAIKISKTSSKTSNGLAGATFSITGPNGYTNTVQSLAGGSVCVDGLAFGTYTVTETLAPAGFVIDDATGHSVTVDNKATCSDDPYVGETTSFTDTPTADIQVNFRDGGSGETTGTISCDNVTGTTDTTAASGWDTSTTVTGIHAPTTVTCTITIDP
jgi:hypothetical protein